MVGFVGAYVFGGGPVELSGMVDPLVRRCGTGARLLDAALVLCDGPALLVVPRTSAGGRALALTRGGTVHHSEHSLELRGRPVPGQVDPALQVRPAGEPDVPLVAGLVVDPRVQGRGLGRDLLRRVCEQLVDGGAASVALQVSVDNDRALGLYTSLGFAKVSTEDYYAVAAAPS